MKAVILMKQGKFGEAERLLRSTLGKDPENFDLLYNLAYTYEQEQKILPSDQLLQAS
jgi:predicted Zn-dependent protease